MTKWTRGCHQRTPWTSNTVSSGSSDIRPGYLWDSPTTTPTKGGDGERREEGKRGKEKRKEKKGGSQRKNEDLESRKRRSRGDRKLCIHRHATAKTANMNPANMQPTFMGFYNSMANCFRKYTGRVKKKKVLVNIFLKYLLMGIILFQRHIKINNKISTKALPTLLPPFTVSDILNMFIHCIKQSWV